MRFWPLPIGRTNRKRKDGRGRKKKEEGNPNQKKTRSGTFTQGSTRFEKSNERKREVFLFFLRKKDMQQIQKLSFLHIDLFRNDRKEKK